MIVFPHAKINLGLHVTSKRSDGYHNIETVFYPIAWCDIMEILPGEKHTSGIEVHLSGLPVQGKHADNLCVKAYYLLKNDYPIPALKLYLHKQIPMGAGLGGGSSDAAAFIHAVNELCSLGMSVSEMQNYAKRLGADCAFFIEGNPVHAIGRGDEFTSVNVSLAGHFIYVVHPGIHVSTAEAYANVVPEMPSVGIPGILANDVSTWKNKLTNDFERSVFSAHPAIATIKQKMYDAGAIYSCMSGSGSAVFGIFKEEPKALAEFAGMNAWIGVLK
jgi:4-diphosphocytidyl-2-C-methyl-D-erythritol kinase